MSARHIVVSAIWTMLSVIGLIWWMFSLLAGSGTRREDLGRAVELLAGSKITIALLVNFAVNVYILLALAIKTIFFKQIYPSECQKVLEKHVDYVLFKGTVLLLVVPPIISQMVIWTIWLVVLCSLKIFQSFANDRLERLYTSPTVTPSRYLRIFSALLLVLAADLFWIKLCMVAYTSFGSSLYLLSFFEPLSIAFETLLALIVHGFHLIEIWQMHSVDNGAYCLASLDFYKSTEADWKGHINRNCGFLLDVVSLLMSVGHYLTIWWLQGMTFHLVNAVLFLYLCHILSTIVKRVKSFIKLESAPVLLGEEFPDATNKELSAFDDQCAICRGPMTKAKKLPCNHLLHLACLKSWLDQGCTEVYSCPTCRRLLFVSGSQNQTNSLAGQISNDVRIAELVNLGPNNQRVSGHQLPAVVSSQPSTDPI